MLRTRLLTAAVALPLLFFLIHCAPEWGFASAILVLTGVGLWEYFSLIRAQCSHSPVVGALWGMLVALSMVSGDMRLSGATLTFGFILIFILSLRDRQPARGIQTISLCVLGVVYIGFLFPHLVWIHRGPAGAEWIFFILLAAMLGDTGGYAVGRLWGKRKLLPHISPGKTIEGSVGSTGGHCVAALVAWQYLLPHRSGLELVLLALFIGLLAQLGDLCESALKRACNAKDSGHFFPATAVCSIVSIVYFSPGPLSITIVPCGIKAGPKTEEYVGMDLSTFDVALRVVIVFGLLIFVHELGHFLTAKWAGVGVERFSLGFGPKLLGRKIGETEYLLSAIPLGGYVKMVGEEIGEEVDAADRHRSFTHKSLPKRFLIVAAGPLANFLMAFVVFSLAFAQFGVNVPIDRTTVGGVVANMPAEAAGLEPEDEILKIDGVAVHTWEELAEQIQHSNGNEIGLVMKKASSGQILATTVTPQLRDNPVGGQVYVIGIERAFTNEPVGVGRAITLGAEQTWLWTHLILDSVVKLISGEVSTKELGGPILIAQVAGQQARLGLDYLLRFTAIVNVNLAIFNLLPIPILDGGHLLLMLIELLIGRPLSNRSKEMALRVGFLVIVSLIVLVFYNDISRLVS